MRRSCEPPVGPERGEELSERVSEPRDDVTALELVRLAEDGDPTAGRVHGDGPVRWIDDPDIPHPGTADSSITITPWAPPVGLIGLSSPSTSS